jgi:hypothetical protein
MYLNTQRMPKCRLAATVACSVATLVVLICLTSAISLGQTTGQEMDIASAGSDGSRDHASANGVSASGNMNAEVLQELERMRIRIQQLESQLRQQSSGRTPVTVDSAQQLAAESPKFLGASGAPAATIQGDTEQPPAAENKPAKAEPFAFADWTWLNGNPRTKEAAFDSKFFTPEVRVDVAYHYDFNHPKDDTIGGSSEVFRSNEVALTHLGIGGDFHYDHVRARVFTQLGQYATATPRNDASYSRGQWQLDNAYRYLNEAYGGYHFDALHGINVDAGIFLSYVGLFSFYQFDNWAYQPSYVSSNTPWFFTGMRVQIFPTEKLKIEPWIINGWQTYARPNGRLGWAVKFCGVPHRGFRSSRITMASVLTPSGFRTEPVITPTTASKSSTTIIRNAFCPRWLSASLVI